MEKEITTAIIKYSKELRLPVFRRDFSEQAKAIGEQLKDPQIIRLATAVLAELDEAQN